MPARCVVLGSWSIKYLWLLSCKFLWGAEKRWTCSELGSSGKEHHARLWEGLSNWHSLAASPFATFVLHLEFRVHIWLCIPVSREPRWDQDCRKVYPTVSHGGYSYILLWFCPIHGHSYGFHIIDGAGDPKMSSVPY